MSILYFAPHLAIVFALFAPLSGLNTKNMACKVQFMHFLWPHLRRQSIYEVTALQKHYWPQNWWFCIFAPRLAVIFALFAPLSGPSTIILLEKFNFCFVSFTYPPRQSIHEVIAFKMQNKNAKSASKLTIIVIFCYYDPLWGGIAPPEILHLNIFFALVSPKGASPYIYV